MSKPLPKSLHTVTVLMNVARLIKSGKAISNSDAVTLALTYLGYSDVPDVYGLATAAIKQLDKKG